MEILYDDGISDSSRKGKVFKGGTHFLRFLPCLQSDNLINLQLGASIDDDSIVLLAKITRLFVYCGFLVFTTIHVSNFSLKLI